MTKEPLPDGVLKLATTLRDRAENESDSATKESLLDSAKKLSDVDNKFRAVMAENEVIEKVLRKHHSIGWPIWVFISALIGLFVIKHWVA